METMETIIGALRKATDARHVTRGWPEAEAVDWTPIIAVQLAGESCTMRYDDAAYLMETELYLRIFDAEPGNVDRVARQAETCMAALGFAPVFAHEETDRQMHQRVCRYQKTWTKERTDEQ